MNISRHFLTARENWPRPPDDLWVTGLLAHWGRVWEIRLRTQTRSAEPSLALQAAAVKLDAMITQMKRQAPNSNLLHFYKQGGSIPPARSQDTSVMSTERGNFWKTSIIHEFASHQLDLLFVLLNFPEYYFVTF